MNPSHDRDQSLVIRYLLSDLTETEKSEVETRYLSDNTFFHQLVATENDLVDAYVRGRLSGQDRKNFETRYLVTPERRHKAKLAEALRNSLISSPPVNPSSFPQRRVYSLQVVAGLLFAVVCIFYLFWQNRSLQRAADKMRAEQAQSIVLQQQLQSQIANLEKQLQLQTETHNRAGLIFPTASLRLTPGLSRGSGSQHVLEIPSGTSFIQLILVLKHHDDEKYELSLQTVNGKVILLQPVVASNVESTDERAIFMRLPAAIFQESQYLITLSSVRSAGKTEPGDYYAFQVIKR